MPKNLLISGANRLCIDKFQRVVLTKKEKSFDAVKMMREIRDKIFTETQNMTFEQLKEYIKSKLVQGNAKLIGQ